MNKHQLNLEISGITCNHCVKKVSKVLDVNGVISAEVDLNTGSASVIFDADEISKTSLISAINNTEVYKVITENIEKL